jgi:hypothetical protein
MVAPTCGDISGLARMAFVNRGQLRDCIQVFVPEGELTALARHELGPLRDRSFLRIKPSLTLNPPIFNSKSPAFQLGRVLPSALTSYLPRPTQHVPLSHSVGTPSVKRSTVVCLRGDFCAAYNLLASAFYSRSTCVNTNTPFRGCNGS